MLHIANTEPAASVQASEMKAHIEDVGFEGILNTLLSLAPQKSYTRTVRAGADLFHAGDSCDALYSLSGGWVALYDLSGDGRRQILQFALPGAVLGFSPTPGAVMHYNAKALTDAAVRIMPRGVFLELCKEHTQLALQVAWRLSQDRDLAYDHLAVVGRRTAATRVAHLLLELFVRSRLRWPGHRTEEMVLPLTQEDIGDATGLTGVHVSRVLRDLRYRGIVEFHYHKLRVLDPDRLRDAAGIDPHTPVAWLVPDRSATSCLPSETIVPIRAAS